MAISPTSPVVGAAVTGLTNPGYYFDPSQAPDINAKHYNCVALAGTQPGVTTHSNSSPFTVTFWRPKVLAFLGAVIAATGRLPPVKKNVFKVVTIKGMKVLDGQPLENGYVHTEIRIPAGADLADPIQIKAMLSAHAGVLSDTANEVDELVRLGSM